MIEKMITTSILASRRILAEIWALFQSPDVEYMVKLLPKFPYFEAILRRWSASGGNKTATT